MQRWSESWVVEVPYWILSFHRSSVEFHSEFLCNNIFWPCQASVMSLVGECKTYFEGVLSQTSSWRAFLSPLFQTLECCTCSVPGRNSGALSFFSFQNRHSWEPLAFLIQAHPGPPMGHSQSVLCLCGDSCWHSSSVLWCFLQNLHSGSCVRFQLK